MRIFSIDLRWQNITDSSLFTDKAQKLIWEYSGGVPRKINILCDNAFLIGYGLKKTKINEAVVKEAAQDLKWHRFSDTKESLDVPPAETTSFTWVEPKPSRRPFKLTATMIIAGILIFAGSIFFGGTEFQFARLTGFISNVRGPAVETVHPNPAKEQVQVPPSDTTRQANITQQINAQKAPEKDLEPETRIKNDEVSHLTGYRYHLLNVKSPDLNLQDNETENTWQVTALKENNPSEIQAVNEEKQDLSLPEARVDDKEKPDPTDPC